MQYRPPAWLPASEQGRRSDYYGHLRAEVIAAIPDGCATILDVGCGRGTLGRWLKENGVRTVLGVELQAAAGEEAKRWLDGVVIGGIEQVDLPWPEGEVDCIICADVLEHTVDPWKVVAKLKRLLRPGGCIVASIPNVAFHRNIRKMLRGEWRYAGEGLLDRTHLRFFTFSTIEELFASNGLAIEAVFKKIDAGWNIRLLNAVLFGYLRHTLYLHYIVRARLARTS
ncbi:MAG: class I SAM-dependent methyltransferase [Opitutaceae bacterium]|nr:class I SAM-dependent methyltransferase [Opitutaceae bacterium]